MSNQDKIRSIGLLGAIAIGVGGMVGGGIFAVLGLAALLGGGATPIAFLIGGVVALLTAYSYAKLSVQFPSRGGTVIFIDRAFGIDLFTGSANNLLWIGYIVTLALYAVAFGNYAGTFFGDGAGPLLLHPAHLTISGAGVGRYGRCRGCDRSRLHPLPEKTRPDSTHYQKVSTHDENETTVQA